MHGSCPRLLMTMLFFFLCAAHCVLCVWACALPSLPRARASSGQRRAATPGTAAHAAPAPPGSSPRRHRPTPTTKTKTVATRRGAGAGQRPPTPPTPRKRRTRRATRAAAWPMRWRTTPAACTSRGARWGPGGRRRSQRRRSPGAAPGRPEALPVGTVQKDGGGGRGGNKGNKGREDWGPH